jgi:hypothetical protein
MYLLHYPSCGNKFQAVFFRTVNDTSKTHLCSSVHTNSEKKFCHKLSHYQEGCIFGYAVQYKHTGKVQFCKVQ